MPNKPPRVALPRVNQGVPDGYVLGRVPGSKTGPAQLIPPSQLASRFGLVTKANLAALKKLFVRGPPGQDGADGEEGQAGPPGVAGAAGAAGATGAVGATGPSGPPGFGVDGDEGPEGFHIPGPTGLTGATGAVGPAGSPGPAGIDGDEGEQGRPGNIGPQGLTGATGPQGVQGIIGNDGDEGPEGFHIPGPIGLTGATGATGPQGALGFALDGDEGPEGMPITPNAVTGPANFTTISIDASGLGGGLTVYSSSQAVAIVTTGDGVGANNSLVRFTNDATPAQWFTSKSRGTQTSPLSVVANDFAGNFIWSAYDGTATRNVAVIRAQIDTVTGSNNLSASIQFLTRADGSTVTTERLRIDKNGLILVGVTTPVIDQNGGIYGVHAAAYSRQVPTTGFSITVGNGVGALILKPAGTLATGTVTMPATPLDGHEVTVASSQIITALTVSANTGQTMDGTITTIAANGFARWKYVLADTIWFRVG